LSSSIRIQADVINRLKSAIKRVGQDFDAVLSRDVLTLYKNAQARRFQTAGKTEGEAWPALNSSYAKWKRKAASRHPDKHMGGGKAMGVLTGRLYKAATMQNLEDTSAITRGRTLFINISVPYAGYFDRVRTISKFGPATTQKFKDRIAKYISMQVKKGG
jgi:hypothetical protein